jgi:diphthamide synthase subunit DPH2
MKIHNEILSKEEQNDLLDALNCIRKSIKWKPGKDIAHLTKRQRMGHLPATASLLHYEKIIFEIVGNNSNLFYLYEYTGCYFYAIRGFAEQKEWLVIFGSGGLIETAFPPNNIDDYLNKRGFIFISQIREVLTWT